MQNKLRLPQRFLPVVHFTVICLFFINFPLHSQEVDLDSAVRSFLNKISVITSGRIHEESNRDKILKWRDEFLNETMDYNKPIVVMVYPRFDYNNAFTVTNTIADIIKAGNQLLYFEIRHLSDLNMILESLLIKLPDKQRINLIIGGHGSRTGFVIGGRQIGPDRWVNLEIFDVGSNSVESNIVNFNFVHLLRALNIDTLVLESCSTGEGGSSNHNLANSLAEHITGRIFAPIRPVGARTIKYFFYEDGNIKEVQFGDGINDTYSIITGVRE